MRFAFLFSFALLCNSPARADVLFEGFYKVMLEDLHVGYVIQRYEFDPKKKEVTTSYFLKTGPKGGNLTESLKAKATSGFRPISYAYTSAQGDQTRTIDATFKGETLTAQVIEGTKRGTITKKMPSKDTFLASFLGYVMLQGKEGIKTGVNYGYTAVAEEDLEVGTGTANVVSEETLNGVSTFKIRNDFKKGKFVNWVTHKGEVIATASPLQKISTELVATLDEATTGQSVNTKLLTTFFDGMPRGKENVIARRASEPVKMADAPKSEPKPEESAGPTQKNLELRPESTGSSPKAPGKLPDASGKKGGAKPASGKSQPTSEG